MDRNISEIYSFKYTSLCILLAILSYFALLAVWFLSVPLGVICTGLQFEEEYPIMTYKPASHILERFLFGMLINEVVALICMY